MVVEKNWKVEERLKQEFIQTFDPEAWQSLEDACRYHLEEGHDLNKTFRGNFLQVILITLGMGCLENDNRKFHDILITLEQLISWLIKHRDTIASLPVDEHDIDFLALLTGEYDFLQG